MGLGYYQCSFCPVFLCTIIRPGVGDTFVENCANCRKVAKSCWWLLDIFYGKIGKMGDKTSNFLHCFEKMFTRVRKFTRKKALATICIPAYMWFNDIFKNPCLHFALLDDDLWSWHPYFNPRYQKRRHWCGQSLEALIIRRRAQCCMMPHLTA